jgi:hypothetical protein
MARVCVPLNTWGTLSGTVAIKERHSASDVQVISVGKESEVTNLHKADWEHMHEETANELDGVKRQVFLHISGSRIPPPECDLPTFETHEPAIRDGNSVRVASEIL